MDEIVRFVGIDVSKDHLDIHLRPDDHQQRFTYDDASLVALVEILNQRQPRLIVLEATGGYQQRVVAALAAQELPVVVVNARRVRDFAKAPAPTTRRHDYGREESPDYRACSDSSQDPKAYRLAKKTVGRCR